MLLISNAEMLIHAFMTSRLDYRNDLWGGCSARSINKLQIQNVQFKMQQLESLLEPGSMTTLARFCQHSTGSLLNIVDFKILLITYKALNGLAPQYLSELLSYYSPPCPLRSQNFGHLIIPRISKSTAGGRSFFYLASKLWDNLPNNVWEAETLSV